MSIELSSLGRKRLAIVCAVLAVLVVSTNPVALRYATLTENFYTVSVFLTLVSVVALGFLNLIHRTGPSIQNVLKMSGGQRKRVWSLFLVAGVFKAFNDLFYHFSITTGPTLEVNIIAYLWPIFTIVVGNKLFERKWRVIRLSDWFLICISFLGASAVVLGSSGTASISASALFYACALITAFFAVYIVFLLAGSREVPGTFVQQVLTALLITQSITLITQVLCMPLFEFRLPTDPATIFWISYLGIFIVVVFELLWVTAGKLNENHAILSIAYFSPLFSAVLLAALALDKITPVSLFGMTAIIVANTLLHFRKRFGISIVFFLFTTFVVSFARSLDVSVAISGTHLALVQIAFLMFSVLVAFAMNRLHRRNTKVRELFIEIQVSPRNPDSEQIHERLEASLLEFIFAQDRKTQELYIFKISSILRRNSSVLEGVCGKVFDLVDTRSQTMTRGETLVLLFLGALLMIHCTLIETANLYTEIGAAILSAIIIYTLASIKELDWFLDNNSVVKMTSMQMPRFVAKSHIHLPRSFLDGTAAPLPAVGHLKVHRRGKLEIERAYPIGTGFRVFVSALVAVSVLISATYLTTSRCQSSNEGVCGYVQSILVDFR